MDRRDLARGHSPWKHYNSQLRVIKRVLSSCDYDPEHMDSNDLALMQRERDSLTEAERASWAAWCKYIETDGSASYVPDPEHIARFDFGRLGFMRRPAPDAEPEDQPWCWGRPLAYRDGDDIHVTSPARMEVCPLCDGLGRHVAPGVDAHGITESEMAELGEGFREDYFGGCYDVTCYTCQGKRVVPVPDNAAIVQRDAEDAREREQDARTMRAECGWGW